MTAPKEKSVSIAGTTGDSSANKANAADQLRTNPKRGFRSLSIPGLFYSADNLTCVAGHRALFSGRAGYGWTIYSYNRVANGWALHRVWNCGLFAVHHVGEGKSTDPQGWHVTFAKLIFKREYRGFALRWQTADTFRTRQSA